MAISRTVATRLSLASLFAGAFLMLPAFSSAQVYGGGTYGSGDHGVGEVTIATTPVVVSGGGAIVGSGPLAPGYVNTNPTGTTTSSTPTTPSSGGSSLTETQIQSILGVLQSFGADRSVIDNVNASLRGTSSAGGSSSSSFTRDLEVGATGDDVKALQIYLNTHGFILAESGPGSPGNETEKFGGATRAALIKFQKANGITPSAGYFGPKTRAFIK